MEVGVALWNPCASAVVADREEREGVSLNTQRVDTVVVGYDLGTWQGGIGEGDVIACVEIVPRLSVGILVVNHLFPFGRSRTVLQETSHDNIFEIAVETHGHPYRGEMAGR